MVYPGVLQRPMWQQQRKHSLLAFLNLLSIVNVFMADDESVEDAEPCGLVNVEDSPSDSDSDVEWQPKRNRLRQATAAVQLRRSSRNRGKQADYVNERCDKEFSECKGYTHFFRRRKGGDVRPNAKPVQPPKKTTSSLTMLNYFSPPGKRPRPRPRAVVDLTGKQSTAGTSPQTRTRWGRPPKCSSKSANIEGLKKRVQRTATGGAMSVAPTPRRKWNGTVRFN